MFYGIFIAVSVFRGVSYKSACMERSNLNQAKVGVI